MPDLENDIKRVSDKLQRLFKKYQVLIKDNERQSILIAELEKEKEKDSRQIETLQEQVMILKAAALQMDEADKKTFEKNINQYIREIDKCIALLSE